jgi:hypothetical protein
MKILLAAITLCLFTGCWTVGSLPSDQFSKTGFTAENVMVGWLRVWDAPTKSFKSLPSSASLTKEAIDALSHAEQPRTKEVDHIYILTLLIGSSLESQKLLVYMDASGDGYFQHGRKRVVYFHSSKLSDALNAHVKQIRKSAKKSP